MFTIAPPPPSTIAGRAARQARSVVKKLSARAHSKSASPRARKPSRRSRTPPTLLTSTSSLPKSVSARATSAAGPSGAARSTSTAVTPGRPSSAPALRAPATTWAPSSASARVMARPMPLLAPVTTATRPSSSRSMSGRRLRDPAGCFQRPVERVVGDLLPAGLAEREMRATGERLELRQGAGLAVVLVVRLGQRLRRDVVLAAGDQQQGRPPAVAEVHGDGRVRRDVGQRPLEEDLARPRHGVALVRLGGRLLVEGVGERIAELLRRERDGAMAVRRVLEDREARAQRGQRQGQHALQR